MASEKPKISIVRRRVKYPRIEIKHDGSIKVVAPKGYDVDGFIKRKQSWIDSKLSKINGIIEKSKSKENEIFLNGSLYEVIFSNSFHVDEIKKVIALPNLMKLNEWITEKLRNELVYKSKLIAKLMGVEYGNIYIKRQKTRWASCSGRKNLSYNISMIALPERLRDYIIAHEISHLLEGNHSANFWKIVEKQYPDYKKAREELKHFSLILAGNEIWKKLMNLIDTHKM